MFADRFFFPLMRAGGSSGQDKEKIKFIPQQTVTIIPNKQCYEVCARSCARFRIALRCVCTPFLVFVLLSLVHWLQVDEEAELLVISPFAPAEGVLFAHVCTCFSRYSPGFWLGTGASELYCSNISPSF
jgi:hypothetical protein